MEPTNRTKPAATEKISASTSDLALHTMQYFRPPHRAFWHWAEDGNLVEWHSGETLCYREELTDLLRGQEGTGLLRLGIVLLVLAACQDSWAQADHIGSMTRHFAYGEGGQPHLASHLKQAKSFLDLVAQLPADLRKGRKRIHLLRSLAEGIGGERKVTAADLPHLLDHFNSGQLDGEIFKTADGNGHYALEWDLRSLRLLALVFRDAAQLEHHLRTGLNETPDPVPLDIPDDTPPPPADLLEQLARDRDTAGLAHLAQRLVAALHIPLHARGASELPLGGVSDITNRGDFDRLLLSELAQDDLTLTARLVNNEALFLRREEPPQHLERQRTVLMDTTLKMWGLPRVFALSTALACARQERHLTAVQAFALGGEGFEAMDLHTKEGVSDALTRLDAALHCGGGLRAFFAETPPNDTHDYILLSDAEAMRDPDFQAAFADIRLRLRFLAVLHRDGRLEFFEYANGHRKLLFSPKFDLDALLFPAGKIPKPDLQPSPKRLGDGLHQPAFFQQKPPPLCFKVPGIKHLKKRGFEHANFGVVYVTQEQQVLYWEKPGSKGAQELLPHIEPGETYQFSFDRAGYIYVLVVSNSGHFSKLYRLSPRHVSETLPAAEIIEQAWSFDLTKKAGVVRAACFWGNRLFVEGSKSGIFGMDCQTGQGIPVQMEQNYDFGEPNAIREAQQEYRNRDMDATRIRRKLQVDNRGSSTAAYIGLDLSKKCLRFDYHILSEYLIWKSSAPIGDPKMWQKYPAWPRESSAHLTKHEHPDNPQFSLLARTWPDGSQALLDSRGLLHLHSSNLALPDVTLTTPNNWEQPTAGWAAVGTVGGSNYAHLGEGAARRVCSGEEFYRQYIVPFIEHIWDNLYQDIP